MAGILYKWLFVFFATHLLHGFPSVAKHPIFVSVTEIEHNAAEKTLEISCKISTDDFEKTLRQQYNTKVDLLNTKDKAAMKKLVSDYVTKHLLIAVNGKSTVLQFLDYEQQEEGIISYYQINDIAKVNKLDITNNILYEYKKEQIGIMHTLVDGNRKSTRLDNPKDKASFEF